MATTDSAHRSGASAGPNLASLWTSPKLSGLARIVPCQRPDILCPKRLRFAVGRRHGQTFPSADDVNAMALAVIEKAVHQLVTGHDLLDRFQRGVRSKADSPLGG
jgi:hypothetical protein